MPPSNQSNDRFEFDSLPRTDSVSAAGSLPLPSATVNARFLAYLEQVYAPRNPFRLFLLTSGVVGMTLLVAVAALLLFEGLHTVWPVLPLGALAVTRGALVLHRRLGTRHRLLRVRDVIEEGVPVTGYLVQANSALFRPGTDNLPCLALFSFQSEVGDDAEYMRYLATRVYNHKNTHAKTGEGRYLAAIASDEKPVLYRRRLLPFSLTDGSTVYCADVWVNRAYVKQGYLSGHTLPLLASPADGGGVELIPWWLVDCESPECVMPLLDESR